MKRKNRKSDNDQSPVLERCHAKDNILLILLVNESMDELKLHLELHKCGHFYSHPEFLRLIEEIAGDGYISRDGTTIRGL